MAYAVELRFDRRATDAVADLWSALDRAGESSPAARRAVPHLSLAVVAALDPGRVEGPLAGALRPAFGLELTLGSFGFFLGETAVAFPGVAPTRALLEAHRRVVAALGPSAASVWDHYRADALVPHCTLAMAVRDPAVVVAAVGGRLPIGARVTGAALVDVPTGRPVVDFAGPA